MFYSQVLYETISTPQTAQLDCDGKLIVGNILKVLSWHPFENGQKNLSKVRFEPGTVHHDKTKCVIATVCRWVVMHTRRKSQVSSNPSPTREQLVGDTQATITVNLLHVFHWFAIQYCYNKCGSHGRNVACSLLGCDTVWSCRHMSPPPHG